MDNNKKPSEPVEEERWVKMEKNQALEKNNIIASGQPVAAKHRSFPKRPANQSP